MFLLPSGQCTLLVRMTLYVCVRGLAPPPWQAHATRVEATVAPGTTVGHHHTPLEVLW